MKLLAGLGAGWFSVEAGVSMTATLLSPSITETDMPQLRIREILFRFRAPRLMVR